MNSDKTWSYNLPQLDAGPAGPSISEAVKGVIPILNAGITVAVASDEVGGAEATGNFLINGAARRSEFLTGLAGRAQVQLNRIAGNAFRDQLANGLIQEGREVATEVYKWTQFGKRFMDIEVSAGGKVLGGIETKAGGSRYTPLQRLKDIWLDVNTKGGYPVQVVRKP